MQELVFNTTTKTAKLYDDHVGHSNTKMLTNYSNVPTVRVMDGFYEVIQEEGISKFPVLRVPICNTNMTIEK